MAKAATIDNKSSMPRINPDWAKLPLFDRKGWKRLSFGDLAENIRESVMPTPSDSASYVGLEHIDSCSLHVHRWGSYADLKGQKLRMRKGDILFARRNAYLRRVAIAPHDGLFSAHGMILRAKNDIVLPEFLPFLMMSDNFMNRAEKISVGSLSPTINWTTLKHEEFDLPPLNQQRRIAKILWAMDEAEQSHILTNKAVGTYLSAAVESTLDECFCGPCKSLTNLWPESPDSGCSAHPSSVNTGHFVLSLTALSRGGYLPGNLKPVEPTSPMLKARLSKGDFLISRSNTSDLVGLVGIYDEERDDVSFPDTMMRMHVDEKQTLKPFLELVLLSLRGRKHMTRSAAGTSGSMKKINRQTLGQCVIPTPALVAQRNLLEKVRGLRDAKRASNSAIGSTRTLKYEIMNTTFA